MVKMAKCDKCMQAFVSELDRDSERQLMSLDDIGETVSWKKQITLGCIKARHERLLSKNK